MSACIKLVEGDDANAFTVVVAVEEVEEMEGEGECECECVREM